MEVIFLENKYTSWYFSIIRNANSNSGSYVEKHHIIPRCIGGSDHKENLVSLTAREHFVCHLLLTVDVCVLYKRAESNAIELYEIKICYTAASVLRATSPWIRSMNM